MRYQQDKDQTIELCRRALPLMGRQEAGLNPYSYALWYEHCGGLNPGLSRALEGLLCDGKVLSDHDVWQLYEKHIASRDIGVLERLHEQLRRVLETMASSAASADSHTRQFDAALHSHAEQVRGQKSSEAIQATITDLLGDTQRMRLITAELSAKLQASSTEVDALTESLQRAQTEALLDALTGLANRRGFERAVAALVREAGDLGHTALVMADIDHFKTVNDTYGHVLGDKVIQAVAQVFRSCVQVREVAARLGGEEFGLLLPETSIERAAAVAEQIRTAVAQGCIHLSDGAESIGEVTLSLGVAIARKDALGCESLECLVARADAAMYAAKRAGRNRVSLAEIGANDSVSQAARPTGTT